ncbi:MAG: GNAT family N-acetyltransferase [Clostridia bacterium]|nr:GNAT family N-acetyltransferase [Clostridia bacterium]
MTIRRSCAADLPALQALWQEVFGDPPAFTGRFYETFGADCAIVAEEDGRVIAMIHPLPVALAQNGQCSFGVYIYALATAPNHRGRGIASRLLEEAETAPFPTNPTLAGADTVGLTAVETQTPAFSLLIPAEESLFQYYRARGYDRPSRVVSAEANDYSAHLVQGLARDPVFLKPEPFYTLSVKIPEPIPPPVECALWKALSPDLVADSEPTLSHFMQ